jgi:hypothetical protein
MKATLLWEPAHLGWDHAIDSNQLLTLGEI